jgi:uncharacterized protein (TIGR03437 family)
MRLSSKDGSVLGTGILTGTKLTQVSLAVDSQGNLYVAGSSGVPDVPLTPGVPFAYAAGQRRASGSFLARVNLSPPSIGCVTDSANGAPTGPITPGQLITLFGNGLGPAQPAIGLTDPANVPVSLAGVSITFDGIPAPLLYVSATQINLQVPPALQQHLQSLPNSQQSASAVMQVNYNGSTIGTRLFAVTPLNPSLFLTFGAQNCGSSVVAVTAVALNQDGSLNSCANPAKAGSLLTLFVNGLGTPADVQPPGPIPLAAAVFAGEESLPVDAFTPASGSIAGLGEIEVRLPSVIGPAPLGMTLTVNDLEAGPFNLPGDVAKQTPGAVFVRP